MSPNRPSKDKRAAQNRNQRAAREARKANAHAAGSADGGSSRSAGGSSAGLLSRLRGGGSGSRAQRPAVTAPRAAAAAAGTAAVQPPGYRAALSAVLAAGAALVLCIVGLRYPVDRDGDVYTPESLVADWATSALVVSADQPDASAAEIVAAVDEWTPGRTREPVAVALWPLSVTLALPLIGAAVGFRAVRRRAPSKIVNRALYATLFGAILTQGLLLLFLPVVLAMGVAMFQSRRAETMAVAQAAATAAAGSNVIDVDEVIEADEVIEPGGHGEPEPDR